jgi:hypothetical protein
MGKYKLKIVENYFKKLIFILLQKIGNIVHIPIILIFFHSFKKF